MAIKYAITKWPVAFPAKVLAQQYGDHIYSVTAADDIWNGAVIAKGDYKALDLYEEGTAGTVNLKVVDKAANGNYLVEVLETVPASTALIVYNTPVIEEEYNTEFKKLGNFYNPADTELRCYPLHEGDIWEMSEEAFTAAPTVGTTVITTITGKKLTV